MKIIKKLANGAAQTDFARNAIDDGADLSEFKEKPTARIIFGIFLVGASVIIGWPLIGIFGVLSLHWQNPRIIVVGGPLTYVLSHRILYAGMYLAGGRYTRVLLRWATRVTLEKLT